MTLREILKQELFITWVDEDTEARLSRIIESAYSAMNHKLGAELNYAVPGMEQNLFIQYCVYVYNGVADEFDNNYYHELAQVRMLYEVEDYGEE